MSAKGRCERMRAWSSGGREVMCRPAGFRGAGGLAPPRRPRVGSLMVRGREDGARTGAGRGCSGREASQLVLVDDDETEVWDDESESESEPPGASSSSGSAARRRQPRRRRRKRTRTSSISPARSMAGRYAAMFGTPLA